MGRFKQIVNNIKRLDEYEILFAVLNTPEFKSFVIALNHGQLLQGLRKDDTIIDPFYASFTYGSFKQGLPGRQAGFGVPDLRLTGLYYRSFIVEVQTNGDVIIDSNPIKGDKNLITIYGPGIEGLSVNSIHVLAQKILIPYVKEAKRRILQ